MTIWALKQTLTPAQEDRIAERTHVLLPFDHVPDLSNVNHIGEFRQLLQTLNPDMPPETIARLAEPAWHQVSNIAPEDIIAVPLASRKEVAIAEVTGRYQYQVGPGGIDMHMIPVKWHAKRVPLARLKKFTAFDPASKDRMSEVEDPEARVVIRDRLPHRYNRFAGLKWILAILIAIRMIVYFIQMAHQ